MQGRREGEESVDNRTEGENRSEGEKRQLHESPYSCHLEFLDGGMTSLSSYGFVFGSADSVGTSKGYPETFHPDSTSACPPSERNRPLRRRSRILILEICGSRPGIAGFFAKNFISISGKIFARRTKLTKAFGSKRFLVPRMFLSSRATRLYLFDISEYRKVFLAFGVLDDSSSGWVICAQGYPSRHAAVRGTSDNAESDISAIRANACIRSFAPSETSPRWLFHRALKNSCESKERGTRSGNR